jgi:hypothetical protein
MTWGSVRVNWKRRSVRRWTWIRNKGGLVRSKIRRFSAAKNSSRNASWPARSRCRRSSTWISTFTSRWTSWSGSLKLSRWKEVRSVACRPTTRSTARWSASRSKLASTWKLLTLWYAGIGSSSVISMW